MPTYSVKQVAAITPKGEWQGKQMKEVAFTLVDVANDAMSEACTWYTAAVDRNGNPTPDPKVGDSLEGTIDRSNPQYPPKFKKAFGGGGGSGGGGGFKKDPATQRSIIRQHSQEMAIRYTAARGLLEDYTSIENLKPVIDWFEKDASGETISVEPAQTLEQAVAALPVDEPVLVGATDDSIPF